MKKGKNHKSPADPFPQHALALHVGSASSTVACGSGFPEAGYRLREVHGAPSRPPKAGKQELSPPKKKGDHRHKMLHLRKSF